MKKRYLATGLTTATVGAIVGWKFWRRAKEVSWEDFADKIHHAESSRFAEIDGARVHYQEFGDKNNPTLILVHGYTSSTYVWQQVAPRFAEEGFHTLALDLLGFGFSGKPASFDYSIASQARMIERLMNLLGIGRATLAGSSYGGAVASMVALDYPERVEKLVLVGAVSNNDVKKHPLLRLASMRGVGEVVSPLLLDSKMFLRHRLRGTLAPASHHLITKDRIESIRRPINAADGHRSVLQTARNWSAERIERDAHLINQPTLLVWGERDTVIPIQNGVRLHRLIRDSRFIVFKNCGHVPQEEMPESFVEVVSAFCRN